MKILKKTDMAQGAFYNGLRCWMLIFLNKVFFERAGIHTDADWDSLVFTRPNHFANLVFSADIARIDPEAVHALPHRLERQAVVKVDVCNKRQRGAFSDFSKGDSSCFVRHSKTHEFAPGLLKLLYLGKGCFGVSGIGVAHGLHRDWCITADLYGPEGDLSGFSALELVGHIHPDGSPQPFPSPTRETIDEGR